MARHPHRRSFHKVRQAAAIGSVLIALLVLAGWALGIVGPQSAVSGRVMQPVVALGLILAAASLSLLRHPAPAAGRAGAWLALLVILIGAVAFIDHFTNGRVGFDRLADPVLPAGRTAGPMSALSTVCFMLQGFALLRRRWPRLRVAAQVAALASFAIALIVFADYLYSALLHGRLDAGTVMGFHTCLAFILLGAGSLASDPDVGLMRVLSRSGPGGELTRRLLPLAVAAPFVLGWLRLQARQPGWHEPPTAVAVLATIIAAMFTALVVVYARRANDVDRVRSAAERAVVESNRFHRQILQTAREGITVLDTGGRIVLFNGFMEEYTGFAASQVIGRRVVDVFPEADAPGFHEALASVLAGNSFEAPDRQRMSPSGEIWTATRFSPLRGGSGEITGVLAFTSNVTERKRSEFALREAQERTRLAMNAAAMAAWHMDIQTGNITWTEELAALFGRALHEVGPFGTAQKYVHPEDVARVRETFDAAMQNRSPFELDFRVVLTDNSIRWLNSSGRYSEDGTSRGRLIGVTMDVTQRRSLESQLRQAQKMDAIGRLAGGVAHDFNNLLTAMLGYAEFLDSSELDDEQRADVQEIIKAANRASSLTRQLLAFSRRQIVQAEILDVNATVQNLVNMLRRLIGEQIMLTTALAPSVRPIRAAPGQVEQIVVNLVVNARDAMPDGGHVRIATANVGLDAKSVDHGMVAPGEYVMLTVTDSGHGMTDEVRARVFEPFFTTKEQGKGTGLGLATVYGIVSQSGGHLSLDSEVGKGTVFRVYLPAIAEEEADTTSPAPQQSSDLVPGQGTILLVEDEDAVRSMACMTLQRAGYTVHPASNPQQAQILYHELDRRVDLLLTDVVMPGGSGPELHQRLTATGDRLRVLYMSGYTGQATLEQGRLDLSAPFIQKPFSGENLTRRVRELLA